MALQIWLPLNGNLNNYGLSNLVFSNTNTTNITTDANGKIGSCYKRATAKTAGIIVSDSTMNLSGSLSMCCWAKVTNCVGDTANGLISNHSYTYNSGFGITVKQVSTSDYRISCSTGNGSSRTYFSYYGTTNIKDAWHHLALTYDNVAHVFYLWVDGVCEVTQSYTNSSRDTLISVFDWGQDNNSYKPACYINDVRIYDHTLSPREVAEIAKGLVLHYPLNREGFGQDNLHKNSYALTTNWTLDQATVSNGVATITPTTNSDRRIYQMPANGGWTWQANTKYTASVEAKSTDGGKLMFHPVGGNTSSSSAIAVTSEWKRYSYSFTTGSSPTTGSMTYGVNQSSGVTLQLRLPKLELGDKATPWMPHSSDTLYSAMGLNSNIVYDCSGYKHDGTLSGVSYDQETPRYSVAMKFPENASTVTVSPCFSSGQTINEMSVSIWFKTNTLNSTAPNMFSLGENSFFRARIANATGVWYYIRVGTTQCNSTYACKTVTDNLWHLFTITFNNGVVCVYIDGAQVGTTNHSSTATYLTCSNVGTTWHLAGYTANSENFIGSLSDFRVYTTALTAQQVLELYQTPISLAYNGVLLSAELQE